MSLNLISKVNLKDKNIQTYLYVQRCKNLGNVEPETNYKQFQNQL